MSNNKIIIHESVSSEDIAFPDALKDQPGLHIVEDRLFRYIEEEGITDVVIPDFVKHIVSAGFRNCSHIKTVTIPDSIVSIAPGVFEGCFSLEKVNMPKELTYTSIPENLFKDCVMFQEIVIPEEAAIIGWSAFENCRSLKRVVLPAGLKYIYDDAFRNCTSLMEISIPAGTSLWNGVFRECNALEDITLPKDMTTISEKLFYGCRSLKNIVLPDTISEIEKNAFEGCSSLTSVGLPSSLKEIGDEAFMHSGLRAVGFPNDLEKIGEKAFYGCEYLSAIRMPPKLVDIGKDAFGETRYLEDYAGSYVALENCMLLEHNSFEETVRIPGNILMIAKGVFADDQVLRNAILPNGLRRIDDDAFNGCTLLDSLYIPGSVREIGERAFRNCCSMTELELSEGLEFIGHWAFENCTKLKEVRLPESLEELGGAAFQNCTDLKKVVFPKNKAIDFLPSTFFGCDSLRAFQIGRHRFKVNDPERLYDTYQIAVRLVFEKDFNISSFKRRELIPLIVQMFLNSDMPEAEQYIRDHFHTVLRNLAYIGEYSMIESLLTLKDMIDDTEFSRLQSYFLKRRQHRMYEIIQKQLDCRTFNREWEGMLFPEKSLIE